jgi:hypothetical protein
MTSDDFKHFVVIVAGENPEEQMLPYDAHKKVEPYVVYKYKDAARIKEKYLQMYEALLKSDELLPGEKREMQNEYEAVKNESAEDLFLDITQEYDYDDETGDAVSTKNPKGKWTSFNVGKRFSVPFLTNDGTELYQAVKKDVKWDSMHLNGQEIYQRAWEMVIDGSKPENETENVIYENMKNRREYFLKFGTKENYVISSTAFWGYAFLSPETGWVELEDNVNQFIWVSQFYDRFIKPLPGDTKLTIFECTR